MSYSLGNILGQYRAGRIDPSAKAYITSVTAAGATVSATQKNEINKFYKAAKSTGYYTSLKRLYFPIWGVAAANAIDMISLTSGMFVGGVTHAAGYIQSNGTTGYFTANGKMNQIWSNSNSISFGVLAKTRNTTQFKAYVGTAGGYPDNYALLGTNSPPSAYEAYLIGIPTALGVVTSGGQGALVSLDWDGTTRRLIERYAGTNTTRSTNTIANAAGLTAVDVYFNNGVFGQIGNFQMGAGWCADSLGVTNSGLFFAHLQTLWQNTTGLTLP